MPPLFPERASTMAPRVDALYFFLLAIAVFFSLLIAGLIVYYAIRYRRGSADAVGTRIRGGMVLEVTWTVVPLIITMVIFVWGASVYFAMARDGLVFRWMGDIHPRFRTPHRAIALQAVWASVLASSGTYRQLFTRVIFTEWIFFAMMAAGIFLLRRRPGYAPAYRVWGYPWVPAVFVVASAAIVVNRFVSDPVDSAVGLGIVALGIPVYYFSGQREAAAMRELV